MDNIEKKLNTLEEVEKKVSSFESELKKLWLVVEDRNRKLGEQVTRVEEKTESIDFALSAVDSKVSELEKQRNTLQEEVVYLQSQSMRNNLMFGGIPEPSAGTTEDTENTLRTFLHEKMKWQRKKQHPLGWNVYIGPQDRQYTGKPETLWRSLATSKTGKW